MKKALKILGFIIIAIVIVAIIFICVTCSVQAADNPSVLQAFGLFLQSVWDLFKEALKAIGEAYLATIGVL